MSSDTAPLTSISGATRFATVIGSPVRHSMSPAIHNAGFRAIGFDAVYLATEVAPGEAETAVDAMRRLGWLGMSVTMPHKAAVLAHCDRLTPAAEALGAANCLFWDDQTLVGDNTDGEGYVRGLVAELGFDVADARCVMVGAGGAARAVVRALSAAGAGDIAVINRSPERAAAAIAQAADVARLGAQHDLCTADLVINGTPIGMAGAGHESAMPFDIDLLGDDAVVSDLVYHPTRTPLLAAAEERGIRCQNGLSMLVFQAVVAFEHWTGARAPIDAMASAVADHVAVDRAG